MLAFLVHRHGDPPDLYTTVGMEYGAKVVDAEGALVCSRRLSERMHLEAAPGSSTRNERFMEWITMMLEHPVTREAGLIDARSTSRPETDLALAVDRMSQDQISRLLDALERERDAGLTWRRFVELLRYLPGQRIDAILLARLWEFRSAQGASAIATVMWTLARRVADEELVELSTMQRGLARVIAPRLTHGFVSPGDSAVEPGASMT